MTALRGDLDAEGAASAAGGSWLRYRHSLLIRLAGFYLLLSLPALLMVEAAVLTMEFREFTTAVDQGAMLRAMEAEAQRISAIFDGERFPSETLIARELDTWILGMERPSPTGELQSYILLELTDQPFSALLVPTGSASVVHSAVASQWRIEAAALSSGMHNAGQPGELARVDAPDWMRRFQVPVRDGNGSLRAHLVLEIRLPLPWRKLLFKVSYEWPLLIAYLLVFSLGTALFFRRWVTARLNRIATAADAWRQGEFAVLIDDPANDELGGLSRRLDRMAADLRDLVHARAEVAMLNERARLARDLHDTVKQKAFALTLQIAAVRADMRRTGGEGSAALEESRKLAEEIQRELALILDELRHDDSAENFHDELQARIQAWSRRSGIQLRISLRACAAVAADQRDTLARLIDEALANVQRHSGASLVEIDFSEAHGRMRLSIADNGRGMQGQRSDGMGLGNMRKRAADLPGGSLDVEADAGVRIIVVWRIDEDLP